MARPRAKKDGWSMLARNISNYMRQDPWLNFWIALSMALCVRHAYRQLDRMQVARSNRWMSLANVGLKSMSPDTFVPKSPGAFAAQERLEELKLNNNELTEIPQSVFTNLPNLRILLLDSNRISSLYPSTFEELHSLECLHLGGNQLRTLPINAFSGLHLLQMLAIGGNSLQTLPDDFSDDLTSLRVLSLAGNHIHSLSPSVFDGAKNLEQLLLNHNHLKILPAGIFSNLRRLQVLDLTKNPLRVLPAEVYHALVKMLSVRTRICARPPCVNQPSAAALSFRYQGPCWDDSDVITYEEAQGYVMSWDEATTVSCPWYIDTLPHALPTHLFLSHTYARANKPTSRHNRVR